MSVRLEILGADDTLVAKASFKAGDKIRFVVDSESRIGHLRAPGDQLGQALGVPVEYVVRPKAKPEDTPSGPIGKAVEPPPGKTVFYKGSGQQAPGKPR